MTSVINYFLYNLVQLEKNKDQTKRTNSDWISEVSPQAPVNKVF